MNQDISAKKNSWPAIVLMILSPMLTEVLPGATRFSSIFVFPIEMCVWGGGAILIRAAVRKTHRNWISMLLLALCLAIAEEWLIQQTSLAPMVIRLRGETYARTFGINYVYLLWALIYEPVFAVLLPVYLTELIFPDRSRDLWIGNKSLFLFIPLFIIGSLLAWFSWTRIARPKVFHVPLFSPPLWAVACAVLCIGSLIFAAFSLKEKGVALSPRTEHAPNPILLSIIGAIWAVLLYGIVLLGFGLRPSFPPALALAGGLILALAPCLLLPRWFDSPTWRPMHQFALICGVVCGSMLIGFIGFMGTPGPDLYFKILINLLAIVLLIMLGINIKKHPKVG